MIDFNSIFNAAVSAAITQATQPLVERIAELEKKLTDLSPVVDMDALRELVTPLVGSMVEAKIEEAINAHQEDYDHDEYDRMLRTMEDHDLDDFVKQHELEDAVKDAVSNLTFDISVS